MLQDEAVNARIVDAVREAGADAWFDGDAKRFLGNDHAPDEWDVVTDILDVWFDSGSTHAFVVEPREELGDHAHLYLEGHDQHRGWFQSSLLESCGTRGKAPYDAVLTHGFTLNEDGRKMSKSSGTGVDPQQVINQYGADILRLWVTSTNYFEDQRIGAEIIKGQVEAYRKIRNTLRFMLGNLNGFQDSERLQFAEMPELERWVLHRVWELDALVRRSVADFEFNPMYQALYQFTILDLSAFYFDIRKDALYCDAKESLRRRAARTVLDTLFHHLTTWLAPILCFTAEEVWQSRLGGDADSIHRQLFPDTPDTWRDDALAAKWSRIRAVRRVVTGALEVDRREKRIGSSLQAIATLFVEDAETVALLEDLDLAEIAITSGANLTHGSAPNGAFTLEDVAGVGVVTALAEGGKCQRCWMVLPEVNDHEHGELCRRCENAVVASDVKPEFVD